MEGITEIRPASTDELLRNWMDRQIELHREIAEPFYFEDSVLEECGIDAATIHVYGFACVRALAKAAGAAWRVDRLKYANKDLCPYRLSFVYKGCTFFDLGDDDELNDKERAFLAAQERQEE